MNGSAIAVLGQRLARGVAAGLAAGVVGWVVECAANWALGGTLDGRAALDGPWKLIATSRGERFLFDLAHDHDEANNLVSREPERAKELERRLEPAMSVMVTDAGSPARVNLIRGLR